MTTTNHDQECNSEMSEGEGKDKSKIMQGKSKSIIGKFPYIPIILGERFIEIFWSVNMLISDRSISNV